MSLFKSSRILRRFLNTAASNSKPILNGQPEAGSQCRDLVLFHQVGSNHGQARRTGHSPLLSFVLWKMLELPVYMAIAYPIASWLNKSKGKARFEEIMREVNLAMAKKYLRSLNREADEDWRRHVEALRQAKRLAEDLKHAIEKKKWKEEESSRVYKKFI